MASSFLGKLWRGSVTPDPEVAELEGELRVFLQERAAWKRPAAWLLRVLPQLLPSDEKFAVSLPADPSPVSAPRHGCLDIPSLQLDPQKFAARWRLACEAYAAEFAEAAEGPGCAVRSAARAFDRGGYAPADLVRLLGKGADPRTWEDVSTRLGLPRELLTLFLRFTLFPWLQGIEREQARMRADHAGERGHCPTCGQFPLLVELRGLECLRFLRCGWCAAAWQVPRIFCPACEHQDYRRIRTLREQTPGVQRSVSLCESCGACWKTLATLGPLSARRLWVADGTSTYLDVITQSVLPPER